MRSQHADYYNHDEDAPLYDADVADETHPIRAGYRAALTWVIGTARITPASRVLDLGAGTGNLSRLIPACGELVCVDVSAEMTALARPKLAHLADAAFVRADLLEYFDREPAPFDAIISTYAVHHLTEPEKRLLFDRVKAALKPGGRAVFADLMCANEADERAKIDHYRAAGATDTAEAIEEEFFWRLDAAQAHLRGLGFTVQTRSFSDLSWGMSAQELVDSGQDGSTGLF